VKFYRATLPFYVTGGEVQEIVLYHDEMSFTANIRSTLSLSVDPQKLLENLTEKIKDLLNISMGIRSFEMERH
jgi:hypothetical protein